MTTQLSFYHDRENRRAEIYGTHSQIIFDVDRSITKSRHWVYPKSEQPVMNHSVKRRKVRNISTGEIYESIADCARSVGMTVNSVAGHCHGLRDIKLYEFTGE